MTLSLSGFLFTQICPIIGVLTIVIAHILYETFCNDIIMLFIGEEGFGWLLFLLMILGGVLVLLPLVGFFGLMVENPRLVLIFLVLLVVVFLAKVYIVVSLYLKWGIVDRISGILQSLFDATCVPSELNCASWILLQKTMNCCGIAGPSDWTPADSDQPALPDSCCDILPTGQETCTLEFATEGCSEMLQQKFHNSFIILLGADTFVAVTHCLCIGATIYWLLTN